MERVIREDKFEHAGESYEILLFGNGWSFTVRSYRNGELANGYSYSVDLPTAIDLETVQGLDAIQVLFDKAKGDIESNLWQRNVGQYVVSLNKSSSEALGCTKCGSRSIATSAVDEREMYLCQECDHLWYSKRGYGNGPQHMLDDITEEVREKGTSEIDVLVLINCVFRDSEGKPSFNDRLSNWARQNHLAFEYTLGDNGQQNIRFSRRIVRVKVSD